MWTREKASSDKLWHEGGDNDGYVSDEYSDDPDKVKENEEVPRNLPVNFNLQNKEFINNKIRTAKYNLLTFLPLNLYT